MEIKNNYIKFEDKPNFIPTLTPVEMFKMGIFGGGYFQIFNH